MTGVQTCALPISPRQFSQQFITCIAMCKYRYVYYSVCRHQELVRFDYCEAAKRLISFTSCQSPSHFGLIDNADNSASVEPISAEQDFSDISSLSLTTSLDDYSPFTVPTGRKPHAYREEFRLGQLAVNRNEHNFGDGFLIELEG